MIAYVEIPLTRGLVALVDIDDYPLVRPHRWHAQISGNTAYATRVVYGPGHIGTRIAMHTAITGYARTDHKTGDGLDNRRANLRPATPQENVHNIRARRGGTSEYKGVSRGDRKRKPWRVDIAVDGRQRFLGCYATEVEAARVYDEAVRELHGDFAALNFPRPGEQSAHRPTLHKGAA